MKSNQQSIDYTIGAALLLLALLFVFGVLDIKAQSPACANNDQLVINTSTKTYQCITPGALPAGTGTTMIIANASSIGTTLNKFAKLTGAPSTAVISSNGDTADAIGIVTAGAGTTGNATITILGQVSCVFDGATTAGNYVTIAATGGGCHDAGAAYPTSGATYGRVLSTNGGAGTYVMELMTPDIAFQNAGNGKSKPGGSSLDYQYNNSGVFAGGNLKQESTNVVAVNNSAAQTFKVYTNAGNTQGLQLYLASGNIPTLEAFGSSGASMTVRAQDIQFRTGTGGSYTTRWSVHSGGRFYPEGSDGGLDIGDSTHRVGTFFIRDTITFTQGTITSSTKLLDHTATWNSGGVTFQNIFSNITDTASAAASTLIDLQVGSATKFKVDKAGVSTSVAYATSTNCSDSAGAAACGSAAAGSVVIDAGSTSVVVSTTAVTANSQIFVQYDSSLGTRLSVTCNTTPALPAVTARTAATSFTITVPAAPVTNPACYSYFIVN